MRILILEHEPDAPAALLSEWAQARGHEQTVAPVPQLIRWPTAHDYDAIVSLGSDTSVHADPRPWLSSELALLRAAHDADVPVLGICFGAQALARSLDAPVRRATVAEIRWRTIETTAPELVRPGPWFFWHEDEFELPEGGRLLAGTERQTTAFASRRSLGLQFHPEVDAAVVERWVDGGRAKLADQGIDADALRHQATEHGQAARERAFEQFDRIAAWWG